MFKNLDIKEISEKIEISEHCAFRFCERYRGCDKDTKKSFYWANRKDIDIDIRKMIEFSTLFYSGKVKKFPERNYFKSGGNCIVTDIENTTMISIWKIGFGSPYEETNSEIFDKLIKDLDRFNEDVEELWIKTEEDVEQYKLDIKDIEDKIDGFRKDIALLNAKREIIKSRIKLSESEYEKKTDNLYELFQSIVGRNFGKEVE